MLSQSVFKVEIFLSDNCLVKLYSSSVGVTDSKILTSKFRQVPTYLSLQFIPGFWCQVIWLAEKRGVLPGVFAFLQFLQSVWLVRLSSRSIVRVQPPFLLSTSSSFSQLSSLALHCPSSALLWWQDTRQGSPTFHKLRGNQWISSTHPG